MDGARAGVAENRGIFGQRELTRCELLLESFEARQPQAVGLDFPDHVRAAQQGDAAAGGRIHAADKAADAARPGHADRPF
jgi:hypothetical protein